MSLGSRPPPSPALTGTTTGCTTPDPFAGMGGGTCYNGGWLPPGRHTTIEHTAAADDDKYRDELRRLSDAGIPGRDLREWWLVTWRYDEHGYDDDRRHLHDA